MIKRRAAFLFLLVVAFAGTGTVFAEKAPLEPRPEMLQPEFRTFDSKLGSLKDTVLTLSRDLIQLEKELLFPGNTQISVFLSFPSQSLLDLQSIQLKIDDTVVSNHIYSSREVDALQRGAVHRVYMGNVSEGTHYMNAAVIGKDAQGLEYQRVTSLTFKKDTLSKFIELTVVEVVQNQQPDFVVKEWQ
ncbi:MAG TPA: AraC family transcriptional regulator [Gammaproteobacteria bacterium]